VRKPFLVDAAGGLRWHARALAARHGLWAPFRADLAHWLEGWKPRSRKLLLLGPSAGWCLPRDLLTRFEAVHAVDLDLASERLFRLTHRPMCALTWAHRDLFADFDALLHAHPDHAVLLCNVAGQRRFHASVEQTEADMASLRTKLAGHDWASFHDLLSGASSADLKQLQLLERTSGQDILARYGLHGEWLDHLTGALLPAHASRLILPWRISRQRLHLVEAGVSTRPIDRA
jgi:hypothetical protein